MDKKYCIFDMDGTLVDSMGYWKRLGREFLRRQGIEEDVEPLLERCKTKTLIETAGEMIRLFGLEGTPEELIARMNQVMEGHYRKDVCLKPGVVRYLDTLKARGVEMGVATATRRDLARLCLERLGIAQYFNFVLSCEMVGKGKDQPDVFLEAALRLDAMPGEIAVFEDAVTAVRTAKAAGFYTVGIYDEPGAADWPTLMAEADESILSWERAR